MNKQFGNGVIFVVEHDAIKEDGTIILPREVHQLINMGYHYCGNNKMWSADKAWSESDRTDKGKLLTGMRLETVNRDMIDIEIWSTVTYISVQTKNKEKVKKVLQTSPKYEFER